MKFHSINSKLVSLHRLLLEQFEHNSLLFNTLEDKLDDLFTVKSFKAISTVHGNQFFSCIAIESS